MRKTIKLDKAEDYINQLSKKYNVPKPKLVISYVKRNSWIHEMVQFSKTKDSLLITIREGRKTIPIKWLDVLFEAYLKYVREIEEYWRQFSIRVQRHYGVAG